MADKLMSMKKAIGLHVKDGSSVCIEGFTAFICFAAGHEIIRQRRRDLTLIRMTPDLVYDQMVAAGVARRMVFSYLGNPGVGALHCVRRAIEKGRPAPLEVEEYSHYGMVGRYTAGASGLPFFPLRSYAGSDLPRVNERIRFVDSPFGGDTVAVVPPINPDVTIVHAQRADREGNAHLWGLLGAQKEAAFAGRKVIVVAEEIVDDTVIRTDPNRTLIPGLIVDAVVHEPYRRSPLLCAGLLRSRQRVLPAVGQAFSGRRPRARVARPVGVLRCRSFGVSSKARRRGDRKAEAGLGTRCPCRLRRIPMSDPGYTLSELMIIAAARALSGVRTVFVGVGLPNVACNVARRTVAPDLELIYESGVYDARPARQPLSIGDPTLVTGATSVVSMADLFGLYLQGGRVEVALLGGAQIDRHGSLNSTVIGEYARPTVRLPGSGGACEIALNARRVFIIMALKKRAFVPRLDFLTSPGHLAGQGARVPIAGQGPQLVVTDKAIFDFGNPQREMQLVSRHPGCSVDEIRADIGWDVRIAEDPGMTPAPTAEELLILRDARGGLAGEE